MSDTDHEWPHHDALARSRSIDEAVKAASDQAAGKTTADIRQRLKHELRSRGVLAPPPLVNHLADHIAEGSQGLSGRGSGAAMGLAKFSARFFAATVRGQQRPHWDYGGVRTIKPDLRLRSQVHLDPGGQQIVAIGDDDIIEVWLTLSVQDGRPDEEPEPLEDAELIVYLGDERIGVAGPEAAVAYGPAIREAQRDGLTPLIMATRRRQADGSMSLSLGLPGPGQSATT